MLRARVDRFGRGPRRAAQFDQRHQMRRIDGMADQAARAARQRFGEARRHDGRGRGHQERIRRRQPVELGEDRALVLDLFRSVFLDEFDVEHGLLQACRDRDPRHRAIGIGGEAMARQRVQFVADQARARPSASGYADRSAARSTRRARRSRPRRVRSGRRRRWRRCVQCFASFSHNPVLTATAPCGADRDRRATPWTAPRGSPGRVPAPPWYRTRPAPDRDCDRR